MKIAFDATAILGPMSKNRGIGNYSLSQFTTILKLDKENEYFFFNLFEEDYRLADYLETPGNLEEFQLYSGPNQLLLHDKEYKSVVGEIVKKYIDEYDIDVFCITSPFDSHNVMYEKEWFAKCKVAAIVYDIIPYVMKSHYLADKNTYNWYMECIDMLRWVDEIQVISQSVKDDLISYLKFEEEKISVIWGAVDDRYCEIEVDESAKKEICNKFGIDSDYIMCTGGDDERKNLAGLIESYSALPSEVIKKYQLVIVCKLSKEAVIRYSQMASNLGIEGRLVLTNFVSNEELLILYNLATLMAFPSVYEGFGLPVVEAWACGTPVLTSNNSSLVQIAGDGAIIVNPKDKKDITRGLNYALTECDLGELLRKGQKQLELFRWDRVAQASIASFNKLRDRLCEKAISASTGKIAFFAPLPPLESGISDYSVDIIKALSSYYAIDVYIDEGYKPQVAFGENVKIFVHNEFEAKAKVYKEIIYQVGNSTFHLYMYEYIRKHPGIVVIHDYNMHGVLVHHALSMKNDYRLYERYLSEDYNKEEIKDYIQKLQNGQCGYKISEWEMNGIVSNYAKKLIVHSFDAKEKLLRKDISRNVKQIWSFVNIEEQLTDAARDELKQKKGYAEDCVLFAAFGHIHETKRAIPILQAFARLVKEYDNVRMIYVGKLADSVASSFKETMKYNRLEDVVKVTGYTSLEEFEDYIRATDVCLNLRYPYNGETSASLVRNLAMGNFVITNNIGSFGEIPEDVCVKLSNVATITPEEEVEQIYTAMKTYLEERETCEQIRVNAKKFAIEKLDVQKAAKEYADFIEESNMQVVNEQLLCSLAGRAVEAGASSNEFEGLAKTLTWLKEKVEIPALLCESKICVEDDFKIYEPYIAWLPDLQRVYPKFEIPQGSIHRKIWEWAFITATLDKCGMLRAGKRGLAFAVGMEPLPSIFASKGCEILATDYFEQHNRWMETGQNLQGNLELLNQYGLCDETEFKEKVSIKNVDMNNISNELCDFDFCWSSCAVEHLGTLELGKQFFYEHLKVLKPGGIAVHTIEYNVHSDKATIEEGETVLFRKCDVEEIASHLRKHGCEVICSFKMGTQQGDLYVDEAPYYTHNPKYHLHLNIGGYDCTSYGIVIRKAL